MSALRNSKSLFSLIIVAICLCARSPNNSLAGGVTIITHGYGGNVDGWVTGMADQLTASDRLPGNNFTTYKVTFTHSGGNFFYQWSRTNGSPPTLTDSGEIVVKLDWSQMAGGLFPQNTYNLGAVVSWALLQTNFISELDGHALAEFPIHLIGHSRGGSLISEISRDLGTNGVWVDHLTTLDPHPLNNDGFSDPIFATDAPVRTYSNVVFHDNYWEDINVYPKGEPVAGAYVRQLYDLSGGYSSAHSDVHLWYHCTIDLRDSAGDTEASITSTERQNWWVAYETNGVEAGFRYSLIGHGNRLSTDQPVGQGFPAIRDGYNQNWDLGAGTSANRTSLPSNSGDWPNLLKFNRTTTNQVVQGSAMPVMFYYQWARPGSSLAAISIFLDDDFNPLNTNQTLLEQIAVPGNGASFISFAITNLTLFASNAAPGVHAVLGKISANGRTRYLYAPELVEVLPNRQPPSLEIVRLNPSQYRIGVIGLIGQTIVIQNSTDLQSWTPLATNTLTSSRWNYTNSPAADLDVQYYRGVLP